MAEYKDKKKKKKEYGYPSAYTPVPIKFNTVKTFAKDIATNTTAADSLMSVRKTANHDAVPKHLTTSQVGTTCKKFHLMVTDVWNVATAAKTVEMIITTSAWTNTLE